MKKYVIAGNSIAAVGCVEGIRSIDKNAEITIVSKEEHHVYCRPLISYYLEGKTDSERIKYRPDDFYKNNECKVLYNKSVVKICADSKSVILDDDSTLNYDSLCVATGSIPFVPMVKGYDTVENKHTFMTLNDALEIERSVNKSSRVLIVGAGLIGLKCAEGLSKRVKSITVCDLSPKILSSILDDEAAALVQGFMEKNGIDFMTGDTVEEFDCSAARMKSGKTIEFDLLVMAVGVRANTALVSEAGGKCSKGITVDKYMKTSLNDIYAAGDCTESMDAVDNKVKVMALLPNAYMQGFCAGINMAGGTKTIENIVPMNSIGFFGLHIMTAGSSANPPEGAKTYFESSGENIRKFVVKDNRLIGFELVGNVERAGIYTNLLRMRTPLDSIEFENLKKQPGLYAFNEEYRRKKLGGVV